MMMRVLGIDGGIASCGWAVVDIDPDLRSGTIVASGTWMFNSPEENTKSGPRLKNADRRLYRGQRRVVRRRAQRMSAIRRLLMEQGLIPDANRDALRGENSDPWRLRADALERRLEPREWALALGHIARHRGFRSNKKGASTGTTNSASDDSKMLAAIDATREKLARYETVGAMFALDPEFAARKRNRGGTFTRSILRNDQEFEVERLFSRQAAYGNTTTSNEFRDAFIRLAFSQRPFQSSEGLVGSCPFENGEKRTSKFAPGFERFRFLSRLATLRLQSGRAPETRLTSDQISLCMADYGSTASVTFRGLRKKLDLDVNTRFSGIGREDETKDFVARHGAALAGTVKFRKVLEPTCELEVAALLVDTRMLDRAAEVITFNEDMEAIRTGLEKIGLSAGAQVAIADAVERGDFDVFKGAGHISAKAAANVVPGLMQGLDYSESCAQAGYDHAASAVNSVKEVTSPVARKALNELLKQVRILERAYGNRIGPAGKKMFDRIHVEIARDVGKSVEERGRTERGIERRNVEKSRLRDELKEKLQVERLSSDDLLRYELWREQNGFCLYSGKAIPLPAVLSTDNRIQVDHILPWSRFGDDSYANKTLCYVKENADKQSRTPHEWLSTTRPDDWDRFSSSVELCKSMKSFKKRNYLLRNAGEVEERLRDRNLNDTRYALRALLAELGRRYREEDGSIRVFARPGQLTAKLRQAWGIESLKKGSDVKRLPDDRHHALDAIVLAVTTNSLLYRATKVSQEAERRGSEFHLRGLPEPWDGFRDDARASYESVFVARQEIRKETGKAHDATIKQLREIDGATHVYERKAVEKLTLKDLDRIPVPDPYGNIVDPKKLRDEMVETLRTWIVERDANDGKVAPPRSPKGDIIRKVRVRSNSKPAVMVRNGTADRGAMVRVDVFTKPNKKGKNEFYLVPIYVHDVAKICDPPTRAIQNGSTEMQWPIMDHESSFEFSMFPMSLIELHKPDGEIIIGYHRGVDRDTSAISISDPNNSGDLRKGIGARRLLSLRKLRVDRLGRVVPIAREVRTWRGRACISQGPQGLHSQTAT